jgi:hypothetical protein
VIIGQRPPMTLGGSLGQAPIMPWGSGGPIATPRFGGGIPMQGQPAPPMRMQQPRVMGSMKKGGKIKKTGVYKLHKGEKVVPVSSLARAK